MQTLSGSQKSFGWISYVAKIHFGTYFTYVYGYTINSPRTHRKLNTFRMFIYFGNTCILFTTILIHIVPKIFYIPQTLTINRSMPDGYKYSQVCSVKPEEPKWNSAFSCRAFSSFMRHRRYPVTLATSVRYRLYPRVVQITSLFPTQLCRKQTKN